MMKAASTALAMAAIAGSLAITAPAAQARDGEIAAGVVGGLIGGALLGGALANRPPPPPYAAPAPVYVEEPPCRWVRERFWDGYGWRVRRVEVCD